MANQPDLPNDPRPDADKPDAKKQKAVRKANPSSSDVDLGDQTWRGDLPVGAPPPTSSKKQKKPVSSVDEDWSSIIPAESPPQGASTGELGSKDEVQLDHPDDASILERIDISQLPASAVRLSADELDEFTATSRELPLAPERGSELVDHTMATAMQHAPVQPTAPAEDKDEVMPTARDIPLAPSPADDRDEVMPTARDIPLAPAEEEEILLLSADESDEEQQTHTAARPNISDEMQLSSDESIAPEVSAPRGPSSSAEEDEEILLSSDESSAPFINLPPQLDSSAEEDEEILLSSDESSAPVISLPPQTPSSGNDDEEEILLSSDESSSPDIRLPTAPTAPTIVFEAVQPRKADRSEEEIDLGALSHEPEDSLAAEFAQLGREGQSPASAQGHDSAVDLFEEQVLAEGASEVRLGELQPSSGERPSGIDLIAEEVESGTELQSAAPASSMSEDDFASTFMADSGKAKSKGDSAVDLGSVEPAAADSEVDLDENVTNVEAQEARQASKLSEVDLEDPTLVGAAHDRGGESSVNLDELSQEAPELQVEEPPRARPKTKFPVSTMFPPSPPPPARLTPWLGGGGIGAVVGGAVCAGALWLGGAFQTKPAVLPSADSPRTVTPAFEKKPTIAAAHDILASGRIDDALKEVEAIQGEPTPEVLVLKGKTRWLGYLKDQMIKKGKPSKDDEAVKTALTELASANTAEGRYWQGMVEELAGNEQAARKIYQQGQTEFKADARFARLFQAALDRLDSRAETKAGTSRSKPAESGFAAVERALFLTMIALANGQDEGDEAGIKFWEAAKLARANKFAEAVQALRQAKQHHDTRRFQQFLKAQNPLSDPDERIFLRCCELIEAYWNLEQKLRESGDPSTLLAKSKEDATKLTALTKEKLEVEDRLKVTGLQLDNVKKSLAAAGATDDDPAKAIESLTTARKKAETANLAFTKALRGAVSTEDDPTKALAVLVEADKRLAEVRSRLKSARIAAIDPARGVDDLTAARDALDATLGKVADKLKVERTGVLKELEGVLSQAKNSDPQGRMESLQKEIRQLQTQVAAAETESQRQRDATLAARAEAERLKSAATAGADAEKSVRALQSEVRRLSGMLKGQPVSARGPDATAPQDPLLGEVFYAAGLNRFSAGQYQAAENDFDEACLHSEQDARYFYFRGLSRLALGKEELAILDFRLAAKLEQLGRPNRKAVTRSLERVQGASRQVLNGYRP